jgi:hypothetical protein
LQLKNFSTTSSLMSKELRDPTAQPEKPRQPLASFAKDGSFTKAHQIYVLKA